MPAGHMKLAIMAGLLILGFATMKTKCQLIAKRGCREKCGDVEIPYPFGVGDERCFLDSGFKLTCDADSKLWTTQFTNEELPTTQSQITGIYPENGTMEILMPISRHCFNRTGGEIAGEQPWLGVEPPTFSLSHKENQFFAVGCNTFVFFMGSKDICKYEAANGCTPQCGCGRNPPGDMNDCSGNGCCKIPVPQGTRMIQAAAAVILGLEEDRDSNYDNCAYSFVARSNWVLPKLANLSKTPLTLPFNSSVLVIDWAVGKEDQTCCRDGGGNCSDICASVPNAVCDNTKSGYRCKCKHGYVGNPYLDCRNKDECKEGTNLCHKHATCYDFFGSYTCTCKKGFEGDGLTNGTGCVSKSGGNTTLLVTLLSVSLSVTTLLVFSFYVYRRSRKRRVMKLREKFFKQNGGLLLQQQLQAGNGGKMKIYTLKDLGKATNNFDEKLILGQGGYGTVYKGVLEEDSVTVAIKKSKICDQKQKENFINEAIVLSQINHRNVVNLLGCCLEDQVPIIVYEFINNGTLSEHLHGNNQFPKLSFATRLRVASESAGALSYLHSAASLPIIHRDVKTSNILLDERLTAKVSDFGASRLVPLDQTRITTLVQGTFGYLDPEYFYTGQLTEKSDVYSFGVVLAELLTGEKAVSFFRSEEDVNLRAYFVSSLDNGRLAQVLDSHIVNTVAFEHVLEVGEIARRCLSVKRDDRPTMKEVAMELERLRKLVEKDDDDQPWGWGEENEMSSSDETGCGVKRAMVVSSQVVDGGDRSVSFISGESSGSMDIYE